MKDTTSSLIHQYSNNFACQTHSAISASASSSPSSWPMARLAQWFNDYLPKDFPEPGVFGYSGSISSQHWSSLLCGISSERLTPPALELRIQDFKEATATSYDIDSFIAKVKCSSVASKGIRVQFPPSCLKNIFSDLHLFSKIQEKLPSAKVHTNQVPLHQIPHFYLGHLASSLHLPLYVFLPGLWSKNITKNPFISNEHLKQ